MNTQKVLTELNQKYPGKAIFKNPEVNPTEILCEVEPTNDHPAYSVAIVVLDKSTPHIHNKTTETYTVLRGTLTLHIDNHIQTLNEGQSFTIRPGQTHFAEGNETGFECRAEPGWTAEDHKLQ